MAFYNANSNPFFFFSFTMTLIQVFPKEPRTHFDDYYYYYYCWVNK